MVRRLLPPRRPRRIVSGINITPLTDVALVLLLIFMMTATFLGLEEGIEVELPGAATATPREDVGAILVLVDGSGRVVIDSQEIRSDQLIPAFREKARVGGSKQVVIRGDRKASYQDVFRVMDAARLAGLSDIALATQRPEEPPQTTGDNRR